MVYYFRKGKNVTEMHTKMICVVHREGPVADQMCQNGLQSFVLEIWRFFIGRWFIVG